MVSDGHPNDADRWLEGLADFERRPPPGAAAFSLDGLVRILAALDDPHLGRRVVHVTGTKGKGTVVHACDAILAAHGVRTMRTTSPHLHTPLERITIDRRAIDADVFRAHVNTIREAATVAGGGDPTWFEVVTLVAWLEARRCAVDVDLLEVGLGGRLDATNVCMPSVAVVTSIGLDHTAILGDTHDAIAYEKGGIIKSGRPVVIGPSPTDPGGGVLHALAAQREAPRVEPVLRIVETALDADVIRGPFVRVTAEHRGTTIRFTVRGGRPAATNAALALDACAVVLGDMGRPLDLPKALDALAVLDIPGRCEWQPGPPRHLADGAHTEESIAALADIVKIIPAGRRHAVVGITRERDAARVFAPLATVADAVVVVPLPHPRSADPAEVAARLAGIHPDVSVAASPEAGFARAAAHAGPEGLVVTAGSFHLVAALRSRSAPPG